MTPVGPLKFRRTPDPVRRELEVAGATAWEAVVLAHAGEALRFAALFEGRLPFAQAVDRYLDEMDVRDPMASAIRSRALMAVRGPERPDPAEADDAGLDDDAATRSAEGLGRFRPDRVVRDIRRKVRESEAVGEMVRLAIARAEETVLGTHIDGAVGMARLLRGHQGLDEAVEDYIDLMSISGGRAQAVYQRAMARLADLFLPDAGTDHDTDDPATESA